MSGARSLHIGIAGPIGSADVAHLLDRRSSALPRGYPGAPFLATLVEALIAEGHRVSAFTLSSDLPLDDEATVVASGPSLSLHCVPMRPRAWPFNGRRPGRIVDLYRFERRGLEKAMRAASPDVVHAHWSYEFAWAALTSGLPHVITCHDSPVRIARLSRGPTRIGYRWLRVAMARHVLAHARVVTTVSPYMHDQIQGWCRAPVSVVPNPLARRAFSLERSVDPGRARIGLVCNGWSDFKNPRAALVAFSRLSEVRPDAELVACGHDFEPGGVAETWWKASGLRGAVRFAGHLVHDSVLDLMAGCDALVHPSLEESFGLVVAEALAIGIPVVAGRQTGPLPWLIGQAGTLVDVTSPDALAVALSDVLRGDMALQRRLAAGRADMRRRFAPATVAAEYLRCYSQALDTRMLSRAAA